MGNKKWNYIFGDSIAAGVAITQKLKRSAEFGILSTDEYGKSKVGAPPSQIVDYLKDTVIFTIESTGCLLVGKILNDALDILKLKE